MAQLAGPACTDWSVQVGLDPIGTAGAHRGYLLVEQPLPWPADISALGELVDIAPLAAAAGLRLQAVYPSLLPTQGRGARADHRGAVNGVEGRLVIAYRPARAGWAGPLVRSEARAEPHRLAEAAEELLSTPPAVPPDRAPAAQVASAPEPPDRAPAAQVAAGQVPTDPVPTDGVLPDPVTTDGVAPDRLPAPPVGEVLVCTHGRRDTCCGSRGTELFRRLVGAPELPAGIRLWRTSHTGGHRFAPTAVVLPSATLWAWADSALLSEVVQARGPLDRALRHYRGCPGLGSPRHQALERAVLAEVGWPLLSAYRRGEDGPGDTVRLEVVGLAGHGPVRWEATVTEARRVPQPDCHTPPELARKQGIEWAVEDVREVPAVAPGTR